jgi:outer membrane protein assembly factor BamB
MSDRNAWNGGYHADDPFAPEVVEDSIAQSLRADAPEMPTAVLVRSLADAYALPPAADAVLARSRATLARRAEALGAGGLQMNSSDTLPAAITPVTRPPQPPRRQRSHFGMVWRAAAAVLVVALLSAGFSALLRGIPRPGGHPTPTATQSPASSTATPTTIPPQPAAPAGVYVTTPDTMFLLSLSTGAIQHRYPVSVGMPIVANGLVYGNYASPGTVSTREFAVVAVSASSGTLLWRTQTANALMQLSLAGGTLYGSTGGTGTGAGSATFYALRASDGGVLWTYHAFNVLTPPVIADGIVYLFDQPENASRQHLHALRASDGSQLWDTPLPQACGNEHGEIVDQGKVIVACGGPDDMAQGGSTSVMALNASDGTLVWSSMTSGLVSGLAAGSGLVFYTLCCKNAAGAIASGLYALDETSGAVRWQVPNAGSWPVFDSTTVYTGVGSNLAAFSATDGTVLWTYSEANQRIELAAPGVVAGGVVYQILNEQVVAISAANGTLLWRSPTVQNQQPGVSGLAVVTGG